MSYETGKPKASPFKMEGASLITSKASDSDQMRQQIISSAQSQEAFIEAKTSASGSGWGFKASAEIAASTKVSYKSNEVLLIAYREIIYGIDGLVIGELPDLNDVAKDTLCMDPEVFKR